jgi:hypothetical protein
METQQVRERASALGIDYSIDVSKSKLVRAIQRRLGQPPCFADDEERFLCTDDRCSWRKDCFTPIAEWRR